MSEFALFLSLPVCSWFIYTLRPVSPCSDSEWKEKKMLFHPYSQTPGHLTKMTIYQALQPKVLSKFTIAFSEPFSINLNSRCWWLETLVM